MHESSNTNDFLIRVKSRIREARCLILRCERAHYPKFMFMIMNVFTSRAANGTAVSNRYEVL